MEIRWSSRARMWLVALLLGLSSRSSPAQRATPLAVRQTPPSSAGALSARPVLRDSAAARSGRPWIRYPLIGAAVVGVGLQLYYLSYCTHDVDDGCMAGLGPLAFGAPAGALLGGVVELIHRGVERARRHPAPARPGG